MPYKKGSVAEQASKVRRTAKRRIARLEKEIASSESEKERLLYSRQIDVLRNQIEGTYQIDQKTGKAMGRTTEQIKVAMQNLKRTNVSSLMGTSKQARLNFNTQQEMNNAQPYGSSTQIGEFTAEEVSIFYRSTQRAWEYAPSTANRNKLILEYYGEKDLRAFVRKVLEYQSAAVEEAHKKASPDYADEGELPEETDQRAAATSADWVEYVNILNRDTWEQYKAQEDSED